MLNNCEYLKIDGSGLHIRRDNEVIVLPVDTVIICAGQLSDRSLFDDLSAKHPSVELVGGAYKAAELDAKAAIKQASYLAASI